MKDRVDNVLKDWIGPKGRRRVHAALELAFFIGAGYFAVGGNWEEFVAALLLSGYSSSNRANTPAEPVVIEPESEFEVGGA